MDIWVITQDAYADESIVGTATSAAEADRVRKHAIAKRETDDRAFPDKVRIYGPYKSGELYDMDY